MDEQHNLVIKGAELARSSIKSLISTFKARGPGRQDKRESVDDNKPVSVLSGNGRMCWLHREGEGPSRVKRFIF